MYEKGERYEERERYEEGERNIKRGEKKDRKKANEWDEICAQDSHEC